MCRERGIDGAVNKHLAALNALKGSIEAEITIMIDLKRQIAEALTREAIRRSGRPDGMCNIAIVKQVELEFLERLEDKFVDVPEAAFPEDPERQQELHAELRRMFNDLRAMIEE